jgi:hypothetical protein
MEIHKHKEKVRVLILLALIACIVMTLIRPIAQDPHYHNFADGRSYFSIPNFWNVISNVPYLLFGSAGLYFLATNKDQSSLKDHLFSYLVFFGGVFLTGFGSAYYHAFPNNETLVWDRLPMTIAFMGFFSAIISEFINVRAGKVLLLPLVCFGILSVAWWWYTERSGHGDLRLYALVQYLPIVLIPLIVILFRNKTTPTRNLWYMMLAYLLAKFFEAGDELIFLKTPFLSGHTLKHFAAGLTPLFYIRYLMDRRSMNKI